MATVIERLERTWVISLPYSEILGTPINVYITNDYDGGVLKDNMISAWMTRAMKFLTKEAAEDYIVEHGFEGASTEERVWITDFAVIE